MAGSPVVPFCRKGHAQITGTLSSRDTTLVFGGMGIDYTSPSSGGYLADLWRLELSASSSGFQWTQISPVPGRPWPIPRRSFGYAATLREGWLLVHGGETKAGDGSILGDLWLHNNEGWVKLAQNPSQPLAAMPSARKNQVMAILPKSGSLLLLGGQGLHQSSSTAVGKKNGGESIPLVSCMTDAWLLNVDALIDSSVIGVGGPGPVGNSSSGELETKSRYNDTSSWRQVSTFPLANQRLRCFEGFSATGVLDPTDGSKEKVFVFGGRYSDSSLGATLTRRRRRLTSIARHGIDENSSSSGSKNSGGVASATTADHNPSSPQSPRYSYSNMAYLYDAAADSWTKVPVPPGGPLPLGRDKHAAVYVRELNMVFVSGGRSYTSQPHASKAQSLGNDTSTTTTTNNNSTGTSTSSSSAAATTSGSGANGQPGLVTRDSGSYTIMDLWGFNLTSRTWHEYSAPLPMPTPAAREDPVAAAGTAGPKVSIPPAAGTAAAAAADTPSRLLSDYPLVPAARYEHSMSVWRGAEGADSPRLVLFGGQHELRRSSMRLRGRRLGAEPLDDYSKERHSSGGVWSLPSDDDSSFGAVGIHSQLNDVWSFDLLAGPTASWGLVSVGGCSAGATGKINDRAALDWVAIAFVSSIMAAFLIGIAAHRAVSTLQSWYRGGDYAKIGEASPRSPRLSSREAAERGVQLGALQIQADR